jgi:sigma-B regulation protein RsbU (phosphoserine phosphatase)
VTYAGAGHPPLLVWQPKLGRVIEFVENGLVLGLFENPNYSSVCFSPQQGDRIVMFTDGIVEANNSCGNEFGVARLRQILESKHGLPSSRFVDAVLYGLSSWSEHAIGSGQSDDITLLAIDFKAPL